MVSGELKARFFEALDAESGSILAAARVVGVNQNKAYGEVASVSTTRTVVSYGVYVYT